MDRKYLLNSPLRTARFSRLIAKFLDMLIVLILCSLRHPLGVLLAVAYLAVSDSMQQGQSIGKKFIGFAVISLKDGRACNLKQSIIRNLPLIVPLTFLILPYWGWILAFLIGLPLIALELYLLFHLDSGHRLGDVMADTSVIANDPYHANNRKRKETWFESENFLSL
jgi:uncharacterized RDD family membrane protein YckC